MVLDLTLGFFQNIVNSIPEDQKIFVSLVLYTFLIFIYSIFIWKFYTFLSSREIIQLNLKQYNYSNHPVLEKVYAIFLFTLEYLIILPFLVVFWFAILSVFLLVLSESENTEQILLISAAIITSTRMTSYISEDLSKEMAKILPFTVLAAFILGSGIINSGNILIKISSIPSLFGNILIFLVFIFFIEFVFRSLYSIVELFRSDGDGEDEEEESE